MKTAFVRRLAEVESVSGEAELMKAYEGTLAPEQRKAAYEFASTVKQRVADVENASQEGRRVGRRAEDFLSEGWQPAAAGT